MIIGLAAGFTFFIITTVFCCLCWSAIGRICGDNKNKIGPMDLRVREDPEAGETERTRRHSIDETAADQFRSEDHTTVTSSQTRFTALDNKAEESGSRSRKQGRSYAPSDSDDCESRSSDQDESGDARYKPQTRNPFKSRDGQQGQRHWGGSSRPQGQQHTSRNDDSKQQPPVKPHEPKKESAGNVHKQASGGGTFSSIEGAESRERNRVKNSTSMQGSKYPAPGPVSQYEDTGVPQNTTQGSRSRDHRNRNTSGMNSQDQYKPEDFNYINAKDSMPKKKFKAIDLRF